MTRLTALPEGARGCWEVETAHGTRICLDLDDRLWHRRPAVHADGRVNHQSYDNQWTRLGLGPWAWTRGSTPYRPVQVGERMLYGIGFSDHWSTSVVVSICPIGDDEAPEPNIPILLCDPASSTGLAGWTVVGSWDCDGVRATGPTRVHSSSSPMSSTSGFSTASNAVKPPGRSVGGGPGSTPSTPHSPG